MLQNCNEKALITMRTQSFLVTSNRIYFVYITFLVVKERLFYILHKYRIHSDKLNEQTVEKYRIHIYCNMNKDWFMPVYYLRLTSIHIILDIKNIMIKKWATYELKWRQLPVCTIYNTNYGDTLLHTLSLWEHFYYKLFFRFS